MKEIKFREHRSGLAESLDTERIVNTLDEVLCLINNNNNYLRKFSKLKCEFYSEDYRDIDYSETYIISGEYFNGRELIWVTVGFSNDMLY